MSRGRRLGAFVWRWITVALPVAVVVLTAASGLASGHYAFAGKRLAVSWTLIAIATVLACAEAVLVGRRQLRVATVASERDLLSRRLESAECGLMHLIRTELIALQQRAKQFSSERVSLFRCDGDHFTLVGRRSPQPRLDESLGRLKYPVQQGILGAAWRDGTAEKPSLPHPGFEPDPPADEWLEAQQELGIPTEVALDLTMRSQCYSAFRLADSERAFGVVLFESTVSVTEADQAGAGSTTKRTVQDLRPLVKEASHRLTELIEATTSIPPERIRTLLERQQGQTSRTPA
jgi:hypothetical protein